MKTIVRAATPADYPVLVALNKAAYPDYGETEEEWRHWDDTWDHKKYFKSRVVAEDGGRVVFRPGESHALGVRADEVPDRRHRAPGPPGARSWLRSLRRAPRQGQRALRESRCRSGEGVDGQRRALPHQARLPRGQTRLGVTPLRRRLRLRAFRDGRRPRGQTGH